MSARHDEHRSCAYTFRFGVDTMISGRVRLPFQRAGTLTYGNTAGFSGGNFLDDFGGAGSAARSFGRYLLSIFSSTGAFLPGSLARFASRSPSAWESVTRTSARR
jgi:hypothetical protein